MTETTPKRYRTPWRVGYLQDSHLAEVKGEYATKLLAERAARALAQGQPGMAYQAYKPGSVFLAEAVTEIKVTVS